MTTTTSTTSTAAAVLPRVARRDRAAHAFTLAYARRDGEMRTIGPWLLGYLESIVASPMTSAEIADTVRGIVDSWRLINSERAGELDAAFAAALGENPGTTS